MNKTPELLKTQLMEKYPELSNLSCWRYTPPSEFDGAFDFESMFRSGIGRGDKHLDYLGTCSEHACGLFPWQADMVDIIILDQDYHFALNIVDEEYGIMTWTVFCVKDVIYFQRHRHAVGSQVFTRLFYCKELGQLVMLENFNKVNRVE